MINSNEVNTNSSKKSIVKTQVEETQTSKILDLDNVCKNIVSLIDDTINKKENNRFTPDEVDFLKIVLTNPPQSCKDLENKITNLIYYDTYY